MTLALSDILIQSQGALVAAFVVFLRVGAAMAILPAFGERSVPMRVRLVITLAFTMIVTPAVSPAVTEALASGRSWVLILFGEVVAGLAIGIVVRLFILALQIAGTIAAQSTSLSQLFGTPAVEPLPAIGHVLVVSGLALAVMMGLHVQVTRFIVGSYLAFPPGVLPAPSILAEWGLSRVVHAFSMAFSLAAPFVIASFIYNLALGVINKAMPQLMVAFVGAPAITAGGLFILFLSAPLLLQIWSQTLQAFLLNPYGAEP